MFRQDLLLVVTAALHLHLEVDLVFFEVLLALGDLASHVGDSGNHSFPYRWFA